MPAPCSRLGCISGHALTQVHDTTKNSTILFVSNDKVLVCCTWEAENTKRVFHSLSASGREKKESFKHERPLSCNSKICKGNKLLKICSQGCKQQPKKTVRLNTLSFIFVYLEMIQTDSVLHNSVIHAIVCFSEV